MELASPNSTLEMIKEIDAICCLLFLFVSTIIALQETFPKQCKFTEPESGHTGQGSCVSPNQCEPKGLRHPSPQCRSPTGRRLICCENFFPKRKYENTEECGIRPALGELKPRDAKMETAAIVGGVESWRFGWPWIAAVFERRNFMCGGSLISPNCVVTAAHCFDGLQNQANRFFVRLGEHSLYTDAKDEYPEEIQAQTVHIHPKFESNCSDHDIAVIRLKSPSKQTPVCLPSNNHDKFFGQNCVVAGWGTTKYDSQYKEPFSPFLQEITIPVLTTSYCEEHYKSVPEYTRAFKHGIEERRFICAGTEDGTRDACLGDSGGPLVVELAPHKWTLVGIVCIGYGCAMKGYAGVYTRLSEYLPWVMQFCRSELPIN